MSNDGLQFKSYQEALRILATGSAMSERRSTTKRWAIMMIAKCRLVEAIEGRNEQDRKRREGALLSRPSPTLEAARRLDEMMPGKFEGLADLSVRCRDCGCVQGPCCLAHIDGGLRCLLPIGHEGERHDVTCDGCESAR